MRFLDSTKKLPYYSVLPKDYKWPYLKKKEKDREIRLEDYGVELKLWQIALLQLVSLVSLFLLMKFYIESIFNNPPSARNEEIHSIIDALLLDFVRHTLLSNLAFIVLAYIGIALIARLLFYLWKIGYQVGKERKIPNIALVFGSIIYFGALFVFLPIYGTTRLSMYLWSEDIRFLTVFWISMFLIAPPTILGTFTILVKKYKASLVLLSINLCYLLLSSLIIFNLISEDIQQSIFLPSLTRMVPAVMFGLLFAFYLLVTRQYIVYKDRIHHTIETFENRPKMNRSFMNKYLAGLKKTLNKSLITFGITTMTALIMTIIPLGILYLVHDFGPAWAGSAYELNSVYGLVLPFLVVMILLLMGRSVYDLIRERMNIPEMEEGDSA